MQLIHAIEFALSITSVRLATTIRMNEPEVPVATPTVTASSDSVFKRKITSHSLLR